MAYTHGLREVVVAPASDIATPNGVRGEWVPGLQPVKVRAVAVVFTTVPGNNALVTEFNYRPTAGSSSGEQQIVSIPATAAQGAAGSVRYHIVEPPIVVSPGSSITFEVTAFSTTGEVYAIAQIEETWENPLNDPNMTEIP